MQLRAHLDSATACTKASRMPFDCQQKDVHAVCGQRSGRLRLGPTSAHTAGAAACMYMPAQRTLPAALHERLTVQACFQIERLQTLPMEVYAEKKVVRAA